MRISLATLALSAAASRLRGEAPEQARNGIPYRSLGRTGELVSLVGLGGYHIGVQDDEQESVRIIRTAIDNGINFLDNSWDYNGGASEIREGMALKEGYRDKVFLMTKIDGRTKASAAGQIEQSLRRLQTDRIDLMQLHEVIRMEDPGRAFAPGGAIEALVEARDAGKIRFIGFTGHKSPAIHLKMLQTAARHGFRFDTVQMPLNVMDAHFQSFSRNVLPVLVREEIGVLGMKSMGDPFILESQVVTPVECLHYAMSLPASVVITGCDTFEVLQQALDAARSFRPPSAAELAALLAKTAPLATEGRFELYKSSDHFDSTAENPEWLG
jgi:aryl-alcohol dehydrogenase-like predicted oxidoreductase